MKGRPLILFLAFICVECYRGVSRDLDVMIRGSWPPARAQQGILETVAYGNYHFSLGGLNGVEVVDFSDPSKPRELPMIASEGLPRTMTLSGDHLYVAGDIEGLRIFDISTPLAPKLLGSTALPGMASKITVAAGYAYVMFGREVWRAYDVTDPAAPKLVIESQRYPFDKPAFGIAATTNYVYLSRLGEIEIYDVSDHSQPRLLRSIASSGGLNVVGQFLYIDNRNRFEIHDISNPANPVLVGLYDSPEFIQYVSISNGLAFLGGTLSLLIVDISSPQTPRKVGEYRLTDANLADITVFGNRLFATTTAGIHTLDISNPATPRLEGSYHPPLGVQTAALMGSYALTIDRNFGLSGVDVVDLSNITNPVRVARVETVRRAHEISVIGRYGYVGFYNEFTGDRGLGIIDFTDARNPRVITENAHTNYYWRFKPSSGYFIAMGGAELTTLDLSDPLKPRAVAKVTTSPDNRQFVIEGSRAYVAAGASGMYIVDLANPLTPRVLGRFQTTTVYEVAVRGSYAYLAAETQLVAVDVSNPASPQLAGFALDSQGVYSVLIRENELYSGNIIWDMSVPNIFRSRLRSSLLGKVIDFSTPYILQVHNVLEIAEVVPANPQKITTTSFYYDNRDVSVAGRQAYYASPAGNIQVADVSNSGAFKKIGELPFSSRAVAAVGDRLYAVGQQFQILDVSNPTNAIVRSSLNETGDRILVSGKHAFITPELTLQTAIVNITNQAQPYVVARVPGSMALAVRWPHLFVGGAGVRAYDITNPTQPVSVGGFSGFGTAAELDAALSGKYFFTVGHFGLHVTDISDPQNMAWVGSYTDHGFRARRIVVVGIYAYVVDYMGGLHVFDVSRPARPRRVGGNTEANFWYYPTPNPAKFGIFASSDTLYLCDMESNAIVDLFHPDLEALRITSLLPIVPGAARLRLSGPANLPVHIETSYDLTNWNRLQSTTLRDVPFDLAIPAGIDSDHFYRLRTE